MPEAVIVAYGRSPIGRAHKGSLVGVRADDLAAHGYSRERLAWLAARVARCGLTAIDEPFRELMRGQIARARVHYALGLEGVFRYRVPESKTVPRIYEEAPDFQMMPAVFDQTTIDLNANGQSGTEYIFRATGSVPKFDGFLAVYEEGKDTKDEEDGELKHKLPAVTEGEEVKLRVLKPEQHFTQPPPRYTEASLIKELEELGIGRPSTYVPIISTIQDRGYVDQEQRRFVSTWLALRQTIPC